ncbi:MAG: hypothetical protein HQL24_03165 [Candidatus Omnitrophica bacterium]|nr:hypothetical protein [Candidatus Omnitrophota bacterium]
MYMRKIIFFVTMIYLTFLLFWGSAQIVFEKAVVTKDLKLLKLAQHLNPFVSEYFYEEYRLTGHEAALLEAMMIEPTKPAYPMYYGLALMNRTLRTRISDQEAVKEVCKASRLKPYSKEYQSICEQFKRLIPAPVIYTLDR